MRTNKISLIVGDRGTGKTTFVKGDRIARVTGILDAYKGTNTKILIVDIFNNSAWADVRIMLSSQLSAWKKGTYRVFSNNIDELMADIEASVTNAVIVFEDATKYIDAKLNRDMKRFLIDSKQKNLDVYFVFHSLTACPLDLVRITNYVVLFKIKETLTPALRNKFPFPEIVQAFDRVQAHENRYYHELVALD